MDLPNEGVEPLVDNSERCVVVCHRGTDLRWVARVHEARLINSREVLPPPSKTDGLLESTLCSIHGMDVVEERERCRRLRRAGVDGGERVSREHCCNVQLVL